MSDAETIAAPPNCCAAPWRDDPALFRRLNPQSPHHPGGAQIAEAVILDTDNIPQ
jgi:hypothetical protein